MMWHLTIATEGRRPLGDRKRAVRRLAAIGGEHLAMFCLVDDHAHVVMLGSRGEVGRLARRIQRAWSVADAPALAPTHFAEVTERGHLLALVPYVLRQVVRHGLPVHPAAWDGSCFWDLVGLRQLPGFDRRTLFEALPRLTEARLWEAVELAPPRPVTPSNTVNRLGLVGVLSAAGDALACDPRSHRAVTGRAIAVRLGRQADLRARKIAADLALGDRTVRDLTLAEIDPDREALVARHLALRMSLLAAAPVRPNDSERGSLERSRVLAGRGRLRAERPGLQDGDHV